MTLIRVTLYVTVRVRLRLGLRLGGGTAMMCVTRRRFNSNDFATSAAMAEVCSLLSAVLVVLIFITADNFLCRTLSLAPCGAAGL